ncbi:TIGR03118 family protein [Duganella sp. Dugasp56]|uniref:TIGR03118 family protein n=1 Tax=Duganella sp. Dugasp56 TaxID=3243046 RepID=UPI0039AEFCED
MSCRSRAEHGCQFGQCLGHRLQSGRLRAVASTGTHTSTLYGANYIYATDFANNRIYVIFAKHAGNFEELKPGSGVLDMFDTAGKLIKQLVVGGTLNAPWGIAMAPANFGTYSGKLLVGNFGDGLVQAYDPNTGASAGLPKKVDGSHRRTVGPGLR